MLANMSPLVDALETSPPRVAGELEGSYDDHRSLRIDGGGRPVVESTDSTAVGTDTRSGRDHDEVRAASRSLETLTEADGRDYDEPQGLLVTKTAGGRDTDDDRFAGVLLETITLSGPDRD